MWFVEVDSIKYVGEGEKGSMVFILNTIRDMELHKSGEFREQFSN